MHEIRQVTAPGNELQDEVCCAWKHFFAGTEKCQVATI